MEEIKREINELKEEFEKIWRSLWRRSKRRRTHDIRARKPRWNLLEKKRFSRSNGKNKSDKKRNRWNKWVKRRHK